MGRGEGRREGGEEGKMKEGDGEGGREGRLGGDGGR